MDACAVPDFCIFDRPFCKKVNFLWKLSKVKITSIDPPPHPPFYTKSFGCITFYEMSSKYFSLLIYKKMLFFLQILHNSFPLSSFEELNCKAKWYPFEFHFKWNPKSEQKTARKKCTRKQKQNNSRVGFHLETYSFISIVISSIFIWQLVKPEMDSAILSLILHQIMCSMMLALAILDDNQNI